MEEIIIYAAGNPDAYPVEYYDWGTGTYRGMIPELLREFSDITGYEVQYYEPGESDQRRHLADNYQVDMISCCVGEESFEHRAGTEILVMETKQDGSPVSYRLLLTAAAPESLAADLENFFAGVSQETKAGMLIAAAERKPSLYRARIGWAASGLLLAIAGLLAGTAALSRKCRGYRRQLEKREETDALTGVGNMDYLRRNYENFVIPANRALYVMFYFYVDLETMKKAANTDQTHEFLRQVASVLLNNTGDRDILARVFDSGFAVVRMSPGEQESKEWLFNVLPRIRGFSDKHGNKTGVGICRLKEEDWDLNEILLSSSQSAREACREGADYKICDDNWIRLFREERNLQADIRRGLENEEFYLYIQFYMDAGTNRIAGGEALARWGHPEKGFLSPGSFIPLMEKEGLISRLDYYSLDQACSFLERLHQVGMESFFMSCNFSFETLEEDDFIDRCREIMETYQFSRKQLIFQITQQAVIRNSPVVISHVKAVKDMGVEIALDDLGEGFTALSAIGEYSPDMLQMDKRLVDLLGSDAGDAIVEGVIGVGHKLGITILAEGAEKMEQVQLLAKMGCDMIQGFYFGHPMPSWEAARRLLEQNTKTREVCGCGS